MKQFGNKIRLIPACDVTYVNSNLIKMLRTDRILNIFTNNELSVSPNSQRSEAGTLYTYELIAICANNISIKQHLAIPLIIELFDIDGQSYYLGNIDFPARATATDYPKSISISISVSTPIPFLLK